MFSTRSDWRERREGFRLRESPFGRLMDSRVGLRL